MDRKQRTWEKLYAQYVNGEMDAKYEELNKVFGKDRAERRKGERSDQNSNKMTKEQYWEYEKMTKIKKNLGQVKNIIEYLNKLYEYQEKVEKELDLRESKSNDIELRKLDKDLTKIDSDLKTINKEIIDLKRQLKATNLTDTQLVKLQEKLKEKEEAKDKLTNQRQENNDNYNKLYNEENNLKNKTSEFSKLTSDQLRDIHKSICMKISESHYFGKKLMNGEKIDDIQWKKDEFKYSKYVAKDIQKDKIKQLKEASQTVDLPIKEENRMKIEENESATVEQGNKTEKEDNKETSLVSVSEFDQKHPRLAKIKNFFKGLKDKITKKEENFDLELNSEEADKNLEEAKRMDGKRSKFLKQLDVRNVAQNGMENEVEKMEKAEQEKKKAEYDKKVEGYMKKKMDMKMISSETAKKITEKLKQKDEESER